MQQRERRWIETINCFDALKFISFILMSKLSSWSVSHLGKPFKLNWRMCRLELWRDKHIEFLTKGLGKLGPSYNVLDAKVDEPKIYVSEKEKKIIWGCVHILES
ncbi:uncharacterized protein LOC122001752 [Zingiber officinale]|uniref:uncharacterized protein LOC122001752 n=1 Tax=Zingiber officinale TaxID=94328 RepID=UPI001C4BC768|nr:uncharacterized protein LOC122001752 [Zingiber officinale]